MVHSMMTRKGQTTIPSRIRKALKIRPGDRLEYSIHGDYIMVRIHPELMSLAGSLSSDKGAKMSFADIRRAAAAKVARSRR